MSRSNPDQVNPAKRFFSWKGDKGDLVYYDKEQKKEIALNIPFEFMVLDQLATITGFCEADSSSYWSNEVRSVAKEPFSVRTSNGIKETGLYKELADVRSKGAKYAKSVYIAYPEGDDWVIGNLKASGAALTAWIEFSNTVAVMNGKVRLTGSTEGKKGRTIYQIPTFEWDHTEPLEDETAIKLDKELQIYLNQYFSNPDKEPEEAIDEAEEARVKASRKDVIIEDIPEEVSLDDVPNFGEPDPEMPEDFLKEE